MLCEFLKSQYSKFKQDVSGAVTVDWVVLTAGAMLFVLLVWPFIWGGVEKAGTDMDTVIAQSLEDY